MNSYQQHVRLIAYTLAARGRRARAAQRVDVTVDGHFTPRVHARAGAGLQKCAQLRLMFELFK
jgi:hypothetical protein